MGEMTTFASVSIHNIMARTKKQLKAKEPIKLRSKMLANGSQSLYLDEYDPKTQKHKYEFLKLYIVPEVDGAARVQNANTLQAANKIKSQRIIELTNEGAGVKKHATRSRMLLTDWMRCYYEKKMKAGQSDSFARNIEKATLHLIRYKGESVTIGEVDKAFCEGFLEHLATTTSIQTGQPLRKITQAHYYKMFRMALGEAVRKEIMMENPATQVDRDLKPRVPESKREFLDVDEVKALMKTPCKNDAVKRAYLFSCFCGLRCSDIGALTWGNIVTRDGRPWIELTMKKTQKPVSVPLSREAQLWMPERSDAKDTDKIFSLPTQMHLNTAIRTWAKAAGLTKHLSFHTARHTFATLELTAGADLYTVSRLLGHTNIKTTQVYAKIVDRKKGEAVSLVSGLFGE